MLRAIFYSEFDNTLGPRVLYDAPQVVQLRVAQQARQPHPRAHRRASWARRWAASTSRTTTCTEVAARSRRSGVRDLRVCASRRSERGLGYYRTVHVGGPLHRQL